MLTVRSGRSNCRLSLRALSPVTARLPARIWLMRLLARQSAWRNSPAILPSPPVHPSIHPQDVRLFSHRRQHPLTHHVHILEMNGDSYRLKDSRQSAAALAPSSDRPAAD